MCPSIIIKKTFNNRLNCGGGGGGKMLFLASSAYPPEKKCDKIRVISMVAAMSMALMSTLDSMWRMAMFT